ncbi:hypothetical protein [Corynebacterium freiburgense]|uniref:hypothetical protein n=1 Tax=Corynebacterium freiburgense TaxID=556548 RepID=UPI0012EB62F5|nr:hypothetical protein [Corynebacterium freiburgense]WJZ03534.1 hypothetical protein CFREI_11330 [Corynebacterium freiburgense]
MASVISAIDVVAAARVIVCGLCDPFPGAGVKAGTGYGLISGLGLWRLFLALGAWRYVA